MTEKQFAEGMQETDGSSFNCHTQACYLLNDLGSK